MPLFNPRRKSKNRQNDEQPKSSMIASNSQPKRNEDIIHSLLTWLRLRNYREKRRFLESHLELLDGSCVTILERMIEDSQARILEGRLTHADTYQQIKETIQELRSRLNLLRDVNKRGNTLEAVREACVDAYGGMMGLDIPSWLEEIEHQLSLTYRDKQSNQSKLKRVELLRTAISRAQTEAGFPQETLAELCILLYALNNTAGVSRHQIQEEMIACLEAALRIYTLDRYPEQYARAQGYLGSAYSERVGGDPRTNLEKAIACYRDALQVYTLEDSPEDFARILISLGNAYSQQQEGGPLADHEKAIACYRDALQVYTPEDFPERYAITQINLGLAYGKLGAGKYTASLEEAIACYKRALRFYTLDAFPREYARTQFRMGTIYSDQAWGEQQASLEEAIACYKRALQVYTLHAFPLEYANTQNNLGNAYRELLKGLPQANLEEAIACYKRALQVYTLETYPIFYALAQRNLGLTYSQRLKGERWSNLEEALACFKRALQVYGPENFPGFYADTQFKLGNLYQERQKGERWSNLEEALACYRQALQIYSLENFPDEYAANQLNLGHAYWKRIRGERQANIEEAIACFRRALQVYTLETSPGNYAGLQLNLGLAYNDRIAGEPRTNLEEAIACLKRALQVFTLGEDPRNYALVQHAMGIAYRKRIEGEKLSNLEEAVACLKRALQIFTLESFPTEHAMAQLNLGTVYSTKITNIHQFNPEGAMTCFQHALQVFTLESSPEYYAITQLDLGQAYRGRMEGKRSTNLEEAIACFQRALQVFTLESFPHEYRLAQQSLASCEAELRQVGGGNAQIRQEAREANSIADLLRAWLTIENDRDKRRFLEAHPDLLDVRAEMSIKSSIEAMQGIGTVQETGSDGLSQVKAEITRYLNGFLGLLSTIRTYGGTLDAIRRACIDVYGGLVLDVPAWLEDVERQVDLQYQMELPKNTAVGRAILLHQAITRARSEGLAPEVLAALNLHLHRALADIGDFPLLTKREAMKYVEESLEVFTHTRYPLQYAVAQSGLAEMYLALASEAALPLDVPPSFVLSSSEGSMTIGDQSQSEPPPREPRRDSLKTVRAKNARERQQPNVPLTS